MKAPQWIEIDADVLAVIKDAAEPFVDNPNRVVRRLLGLPAIDTDRTALLPASTPRPVRGALLPMPEFEVPILLAISEAGGAAPRPAVIESVGAVLEDRFTEIDRQLLQGGRMRWETRVDQVRVGLAKRGFLDLSNSRGMWKLSEAGVEYLDRRLRSKAAAERREA
jgi:hypothetical protein